MLGGPAPATRRPIGSSSIPCGYRRRSVGGVALTAIEAAERRTCRAAEGRTGIVLATEAGASTELLAKLLDAYAAEPAAVPVEVMLCAMGEQQLVLHDGRADVALLHLPFDPVEGLDSEVLASEGQIVVLPAGHPLTSRPQLTLAEVSDIPDLPGPRRIAPDGTVPDGPARPSAISPSCSS